MGWVQSSYLLILFLGLGWSHMSPVVEISGHVGTRGESYPTGELSKGEMNWRFHWKPFVKGDMEKVL